VLILPNTNNIASASGDYSIKIWQSVEPYSCIATLLGHSDWISSLALLPNSSNIVSCSYRKDSSIKIWQSGAPFKCIATINAAAFMNDLLSLTILPQSSSIISGSAYPENSIKIWQIKPIALKITQLPSLNRNSAITALSSFNYIYLISTSSDQIISIWNNIYSNVAQLISSFPSKHSQKITHLVNINNEYFATGSKDKSIVVWKTNDFINYIITSNLTVHQGGINSLLFYPVKSYLLSSSYDTSIIIWKQLNTNLNLINQLTGHSRQVNKVIQLNSNYLVSASDDFNLKVWDQFSNVYNLTGGHINDVYFLVELSQNRMASCSKDKSIIIWNSTNFQIVKYNNWE